MANIELRKGPGIGLPMRYVFRTWLIVAAIIVFGALVSWHCSNWAWLGRFGALVTITTMLFATFDSDLTARLLLQELNDYDDPSEGIGEDIKAHPYLYGIQLPLTDEQGRELLKKEVDAFNERTLLTLKDEMTSALRKLELGVAVVGTLIWAFADLINKVCPVCPK